MNFELRNADGEKVWEGDDRKAVRDLDLTPGTYTFWKRAGTFAVEEVPARKRIAFDSATKKGPRSPATTEAPAESTPADTSSESRGLLSRLRG
jgi:hypothetical protein